jgi:hypothetical protein
MTRKLMSAQGQYLQSLVYCPVIREQVMANGRKHFSIPGGQATWWHCPECQGWHVVIDKDNPLRTNSGTVEYTMPDYR